MSYNRSSFDGASPSSSQQSLALYRTDSAGSTASTSTLASSVSSGSSLRWSNNPSTLSERRKNIPRPLDTSTAHTRKKVFPLAAQAKQRKQRQAAEAAAAAAAAAVAQTHQVQATETQPQAQLQTQTQRSTTPPQAANRPSLRIDTSHLPAFTSRPVVSRRRPVVNRGTFVEPKVAAPPPVVPVPSKARNMHRQMSEERQEERRKNVPGQYAGTIAARERREARPLPALPSLHEIGYEKDEEPFRAETLKSLATGIRRLKQPGDESLSYFTMNLEHLVELTRRPPSIGFIAAEMAANMLEELRSEYSTTRFKLTQIGRRGEQQFDSWITDTRHGAGGSAASIVEGEEIEAARLLKYMETLLKCGQWVREQRDKSVSYENIALRNMGDLRNRSVVGLIMAGGR